MFDLTGYGLVRAVNDTATFGRLGASPGPNLNKFKGAIVLHGNVRSNALNHDEDDTASLECHVSSIQMLIPSYGPENCQYISFDTFEHRVNTPVRDECSGTWVSKDGRLGDKVIEKS